MESIKVSVNDAEFDAAVHAINALPQDGQIRFYVKRKATASGQPGVCITWSARLPTGDTATCQAVTTWSLLKAAVMTIAAGLENVDYD